MKRKIIGVTVGSPLPKPDLTQTDPTKRDYVKGKEEFLKRVDDDVKIIVDDYLEEHSPKEVVFIGTELPELGDVKTLYVDTTNKEISVWDTGTSSYTVVAEATSALTAEEVETIIQNIMQ